MQIHLVDGTYELFRAHFGAPSSLAPDGREVGATRGLLRSLHALVREPDTTHLAIAFDTVIESFRNQLFAGYKTGDGIEPALLAQFPLAERAARALGLEVWSMIDFEADDALATAAHELAALDEVERVLVCSPDKDLAQCVRAGRVVMYDRMRKQLRDEAGVVDKFGVSPRSIPDYLALVGDDADGIPGIPRWGAKSTAVVLSRYAHLEHIPARAAEWDLKVRGAATLAANLHDRRDDAMLYRTLATLRQDVPLELALDRLAWRGARRDELEALCAELGETDLVERVAHWRERD